MTMNMAFQEQRKIGKYENVVSSIRKKRGLVADDVIIDFLNINSTTYSNVDNYLNDHPDWDDWEIAEAVIEKEEAEDDTYND